MTYRMLPSPVGHLTEFWAGYNGTCQETALAVTTAAARGFVATEDYMVSITHSMVSSGLTTSRNGSSSIMQGHQWLINNKYSVVTWNAYNYYLAQSVWVNMLLTHAGVHPIVLEVANGQALVDNVTGARDESGLHYHFIAVVGMVDNHTFICADGDNPQVRSRFQTYTLQTLINARPCGFIVIGMERPAAPVQQVRPMLQISQVSEYFTEVSATEWKCKRTGFVVSNGMLQAYRSWPAEGTLYGLTAWGLPLSDEIKKHDTPYATIQHFERCTVAYDPGYALDKPAGVTGPVYVTHNTVS